MAQVVTVRDGVSSTKKTLGEKEHTHAKKHYKAVVRLAVAYQVMEAACIPWRYQSINKTPKSNSLSHARDPEYPHHSQKYGSKSAVPPPYRNCLLKGLPSCQNAYP
jgi:hypothetical protein